ncbi:MAG: hypothetical protein M1821_005976 [Bathelium mastoideum]|nr:MAG: hypothetical protein M1821_005976 [Bathelium mastoideum]
MYSFFHFMLFSQSLLFLFFTRVTASVSSKYRAAPTPHITIRQDPNVSFTATPSTTALPSSASSFVPTGTATTSVARLAINESLIDNHIETLNVNNDSISFSCKNCSIFGDFTFGSDAFVFDESTFSLSGGILLMNATGFGGTFELEIASGLLSKTWHHTFYSQSVLGFGVPNVVNVGVLVELAATLEVQVQEAMDIVFGVDFRVPDGSYVNIDVIDPTNSSQHGFTYKTGLTLGAVPFSANFSTPQLTVSMALEPKFVFGINVADNIIHADAGAYIDIPRLSVEIDSLSNVDANCRPMNATNHGPALNSNLGNATNVVPSAEIDLGLIAEAGIGDLGPDAELTLASVVTTLPTACLLWDQSQGRLADATSVVASISSASAASVSSASAASASSASAATASKHANAGTRARHVGSHAFGLTCALCLSFVTGLVLG